MDGDSTDGAGTRLELVAYRLTAGAAMPIVPAEANRAWMDETKAHNANRCLPMLLANQAGWLILNTQPLTVSWNGGPAAADLTINLHGDHGDTMLFPPKSHFGYGIISWSLPYVFRTPPGHNLLARGPANLPKDGISPLEGLVETDWMDGFFAMSWKVTRSHTPITFEQGEPICLLVPMRRGELESFWPRLQPIDSDIDMARRYEAWRESRSQHMLQRAELDENERYRSWQSHYIRGVSREGEPAGDHQTRLSVRPFEDGEKGRT
ncbi:MAG: DUF6065 family protein [Acidobacteriota bacterium]